MHYLDVLHAKFSIEEKKIKYTFNNTDGGITVQGNFSTIFKLAVKSCILKICLQNTVREFVETSLLK